LKDRQGKGNNDLTLRSELKRMGYSERKVVPRKGRRPKTTTKEDPG
jgi:hypothetical protein